MELDAVGPYRVIEAVATDCATLTVRARRERDPTVLLKLAKPGVTNLAVVARQLEREAELLGRLRHPCLPVLVELLREGGAPVLVLVDAGGHRLDAVLARVRPLQPASAVAIAIELASALAALHQDGSAHGGLHGGLVELTSRGGVVLHEPLGASELPGGFAAPEHMAPEQIVGDGPDARSDVFLLGSLLYSMLAGQQPFRGDGEGISQRIRHHEPPRLSSVVPDVSRALERIVARCMAKRRHDRYPDMPSLAAELTRGLRRETSLPLDVLVSRALSAASLASALPGPSESETERGTALSRVMRRRLLALGGAAVGLAAVGVVGSMVTGEGPLVIRSTPRGIVDEPGHVRVVAHPWAEVFVDGQRIDVTPRAAPIDVSPGRHTFAFRHPSAPEQTRVVEPIAGQTLVVSVEMPIRETSPPAAPSASSSAAPRR